MPLLSNRSCRPHTLSRAGGRIVLGLWLLLGFAATDATFAQSVQVGLGSYSTSLPPGEVGPRTFAGQNATPKVSSSFAQPVQTNDFWSSLIYSFFGDQHSNILYAQPLNAKAVTNGLQLGYTDTHLFVANDYLYPFAHQLTVGVSGLTTSRTTTEAYGDWTVTARWESGTRSMEATLGHGLPYVFFRLAGGDAVLTPAQTPTIWFQDGEVLGLTIHGKHYGVFAPTGATWTGTSTLQSDLNGGDYLSVALLPDDSPETLALFKKHAYAFVVDSRVDWDYNETTATVTSTYAYETMLMETAADYADETMTALYRHQWLHTNAPMTGHTYASPRGTMKLHAGNAFTTELRYGGVLPTLPDRGDYNRDDLLAFVQAAASETLPISGTYENGKAMGRFSHLVHIADQLGATTERDHFLAEIKERLEDWFTVGGAQEYSYNATWDVLTGYPSGFGADDQINDHHFHASYAIWSAATVAQYDSAWAAQENWGGMVNLLVRDANSWDRTDDRFPFLRTFDAYAGHSWAAGHGDFAEGNNQESSSESMHFAGAAILWGEATNQPEIRDLGVFLYATEASAVEHYWFDVDEAVFPADYPHVAIGMVWGGKGVHSTWFGADPEFIHGINILPITSASLYLGRHPDYVTTNYDEIVAERSGQPVVWKDILWEYLALADPDQALAYYYADRNYEPFDGESRAHTLHWLFNMKKMGHVDTTVFADTPTYAVFKDGNGDRTYVAYNAGSTERTVTFTDGQTLAVPPRSTQSFTTAEENPDAPVALLFADRTRGKAPLTVDFEGSKSFDRQSSDLSYLWTFDTLGTATSADTAFTFTEPGTYTVTLAVTNTSSFSTQDSVQIEVLDNGTPFGGTPHAMPGRIEAEHYDLGGEGRAYHDTEAANIGLAFRPNEGVDLEASAGGHNVYWIVAGEWLEYTFAVSEAGEYDFSPYVATVPGFGSFRLFVDNVDISGRRRVTSTGGWQFWEPITTERVPLEAGTHILRIEFDSDTDKTGWLMSLNYIDIRRSVEVGVETEGGLPTVYSLAQNFPNPFNPVTQISYTLPEAAKVRLEVFNVLGQRVQVLVARPQEAGQHTVAFDGSRLSSGVYLYKLTAADFSQTRRMMLVK